LTLVPIVSYLALLFGHFRQTDRQMDKQTDIYTSILTIDHEYILTNKPMNRQTN
jgi:hypothetical protein